MVNFNPNGFNIFNRVARVGVVFNDSILATDDWGIPHNVASSRWLKPSDFRFFDVMYNKIKSSQYIGEDE